MKNNDNYCVYMHINKINGKVYIGQTCQKPEKRWKNGYGYKEGTHFRNAIDMYGWKSFEHVIWADNLTLEEANRVERLLISLWDTRNPEQDVIIGNITRRVLKMLDEIRILLGDAAANYSDTLIELILKQSQSEVEAYCNRKIDAITDYELQMAVERIAIIKLNRINTEGLSGQSMSGVSESYLDGYPADILAILNRKRKIKIV